MRTITATEFKAKALKVMAEVNSSGEALLVTKRGKPLVKVEPAGERKRIQLGAMAHCTKILGDIVSPMDPDWDPRFPDDNE